MKIFLLCLLLIPQLSKAQYRPNNNNSNRTLISSLEVGTSLYNTKIFEGAILVGLRDNAEMATLEIGYVYKRIIETGIGHDPAYHGVRGAIEVQLLKSIGAFGTYDVIKGKRWLYDDVSGSELALYDKIHGEGTLGIFFAPKVSLLKFYAGISPFHYDPMKMKKGLSPHKSSSINLKLRYTIDL